MALQRDRYTGPRSSSPAVHFLPAKCSRAQTWHIREVDFERCCSVGGHDTNYDPIGEWTGPVWVQVPGSRLRLTRWHEVGCCFAERILVDRDNALYSVRPEYGNDSRNKLTAFLSTAREEDEIVARFVPIIIGDLAIAQRPKCALSSAAERPPLPIS